MSGLVFLSVLFLLLQLPLSSLSNSEGDALYAFRKGLSDPNHIFDSWDPSVADPCTWFHITCDSNNHVVRIDLYNYKIAGTLSPELGRLPYLQYLELYGNNLSGKIPQELGNLTNLVSMDLSNNKLEGSIPDSFGNLKSLKFLWLNDNELSGSIPKEITLLKNLAVFLENNKLNGPEVKGVIP
ncbi:brassinosteroid insensitive 1-associated receptor kinase 1 [Vigna unguiculata]|uniref:Brassinosteroid insensitive 1-associated receptor kinase 1 n=1 Tax=Vigna unguiculata TaxID=3917 RepID=A0A4D6LTP6_VIGUN|nr:brassinosteroid insensitive 1-associated receptor kinase 1 [Vigna unguiculata]